MHSSAASKGGGSGGGGQGVNWLYSTDGPGVDGPWQPEHSLVNTTGFVSCPEFYTLPGMGPNQYIYHSMGAKNIFGSYESYESYAERVRGLFSLTNQKAGARTLRAPADARTRNRTRNRTSNRTRTLHAPIFRYAQHHQHHQHNLPTPTNTINVFSLHPPVLPVPSTFPALGTFDTKAMAFTPDPAAAYDGKYDQGDGHAAKSYWDEATGQ